jgi:hypothetical protein
MSSICGAFRKSAAMRETAPAQQGGFSYWVSDEQLRAYMAMPLLDRLRWVEAARQFTLAGQTPETRERMERLRRGGQIV